MVKIYYDNDVDSSALAGKTIAVIGYGSQGRASMTAMLTEWANHPLEVMGEKIRKMSGVR